MCIVRIGVGDVPYGGLGLDPDELLEVVDLEDRLGGVADLPDDDRGDLYGVAVRAVDLGHLGLVVADSGGYAPPRGERIDTPEAGSPDRAGVFPEELHHPGLARGHRGESAQHDVSNASVQETGGD